MPQCPYVMDDAYLDMIFERYKIDFVVHGDDPCIVDGKNVYENAISRGRYCTIPRTEGVSTTDIVGRMLLFSREHHQKREVATGTGAIAKHTSSPDGGQDGRDGLLASAVHRGRAHHYNRPSNFLTT
eukprot:COSAG01_NODE_480_length_16473_cov_655.154208_4_plen_127_part_00